MQDAKGARRLAGLAVLGCAALVLAAASAGLDPAEAASSASSPTPPQAAAGKYVGSETCQGCHEEVFKKFTGNPHWRFRDRATAVPAEAHGCESCHGPGADHVEAGGDKTKIRNFKTLGAREISDTCMTCHSKGQEHGNFTRSAHANNNVSCVGCHSVHGAKQEESLLAEKQPQLCFGCHGEAKPEFSKPFRHRVLEGMVACNDCHAVHGGFRTRQVRSTPAQDAVCFKCHSDKAGPFVFEHAPVKTEGCMSCHHPHGSSNPRMLKRSQVNLLCLECHTFTVGAEVNTPGIPSFHNQAQRYQACTMCHTAVHGSNFSDVFFR